MSRQLIDRSASLSNPFSWPASLPPLHLLTHCHPPCLSPNWVPTYFCFFFFLSVWFIFVAVPSSLPFQKVMHTRKRHSELYHELNHSSKFHTIDRYSRDPAMSTFKVRSLPTCGIWDNCCDHCTLHPDRRTFTRPQTSHFSIVKCLR